MEGNFSSLFALRVQSRDVALSHHFSKASKKATHISKRIQNYLIDLFENEILEQIVKEILTCNCFAILVDETSDTSHAEQLCICISYVTSNAVIKERFLGFANLNDLSASSIAHEIQTRLTSLGISIKSRVGQGYDGASVMSGKSNGVQGIIKEKSPAAAYVHRARLCLNLTLNHACELVPI